MMKWVREELEVMPEIEGERAGMVVMWVLVGMVLGVVVGRRGMVRVGRYVARTVVGRGEAAETGDIGLEQENRNF